MQQFIKQHWVTIAAVFGALEAIYTAVDGLLKTGEAPTPRQLATTAGVALFMWMVKRPGDVTKQQANEHAADMVRRSMPTGVPPDDQRDYR